MCAPHVELFTVCSGMPRLHHLPPKCVLSNADDFILSLV